MSENPIDVIESPRQAATLFGHAEAERAFLAAWRGRRLAHAWLIGGPEGIGKATFAWACARFALCDGRGDLRAPGDARVAKMVAAGSHPGVRLVRRSENPKTQKLRGDIAVEDIRALQPFFRQTAPHWRVAIVDAADDMSTSAANALLKLLEEPPARALLLLVCHAPGRLLPTLRSRCRCLALRPLAEPEMLAALGAAAPEIAGDTLAAIAAEAQGSPGCALRLHAAGGLALVQAVDALFDRLPALDGEAAHALAERCAGPAGEAGFAALAELLTRRLAEIVRAGAGDVQPAHATQARLLSARPVEAWLALWDKCTGLFARAEGLSLDRKQAMLNALFAVAAA